jgi:hypothetical protein
MRRFLLAIALLSGGCSNKVNTGDDATPGTMRLNVPLGDRLRDVDVFAGRSTDVTFEYSLPSGAPRLKKVTVDLIATLESAQIDLTNRGSLTRGLRRAQEPPPQARAWAMVGPPGAQGVVCETGAVHGPYTISGDAAGLPSTVEPRNAEATQASLQLINAGSFVVCLRIESPVSAKVTIENIIAELEIASEDCELEPASIAGIWVGTYECSDSCGQPLSGSVRLDIAQQGTEAAYTDDSGDAYAGVICGNEFTFERKDDPEEEEAGQFILQTDGTARKTSTWRQVAPPNCGGDCVDTLQREQ